MVVTRDVKSDRPISDRVRQLYNEYSIALDDLNLESWPGFFAEKCLYRITTRENWDRGFPLSTIVCESRGMLIDRVAAIRGSMMYAPRSYRRFQSLLHVQNTDTGELEARSNFLVVQTLVDRPSDVAFCGVAFDKIVDERNQLRFRERVCVLDTEMIPNSLIYPL